MARPRVDVVVPFRGDLQDLERLRVGLMNLRLKRGDTLLVVDNTPGHPPLRSSAAEPLEVLQAAERTTPGFARNRGAAAGSSPWLVFLDADTAPEPDLLERFFDPPPHDRVGLLAGDVRDEPVPPGGPAPARFAYLEQKMSQQHTFGLGQWAFSQTANVACRRAAFDEVGGFREDIRAGEDADFCYRLRRGGWEIERREQASVTHHNRQTVRGFVTQKALHGAAAAWLDREYPGSFPPRRRPGLLWWAIRRATAGLVRAARRRDRDLAVCAIFDPLELLAYEFGRSLENRR